MLLKIWAASSGILLILILKIWSFISVPISPVAYMSESWLLWQVTTFVTGAGDLGGVTVA